MLGRRSIRGRTMVATVFACLTAAGLLAGCGSSSSNSSTAGNQVVRAAYVSTQESGYQMHLGMVLSASSLPAPITATGSGAFSTASHQGEVTLDMNFGSIPQVAAVLGSNIFRLQEVIDHKTVYIGLPDALASKLPSLNGKRWLKIDIAKAAAAAGIPGVGSLLNNPASSDPGQFLSYLRAAGTVTKVGSEQVGGIATTHYRAVIDLDKVPNALPAASRSQAQQAIASLEKLTNLHQIPVDIWIDGQNLVRRMRFAFREALPTGQTVNIAMTMDMVSYGPQPPPTLPPPDQVTDISSLAGAGAGGGGGADAAGGSGVL